jgi:hypothetical protein
VAYWKEGGSARGAHLRGGLATVAAPDSSLSVADFIGGRDRGEGKNGVWAAPGGRLMSRLRWVGLK